MKIGIDITWMKPKKSGGVESYIRNLLDGFLTLDDDNEYVLFTALDNNDTLDKYFLDKRFKCVKCNVNANDVKGHLLWQNTKERKIVKKEKLDLLFNPVYELPLLKIKNLKVVTTIHDLQALHYPEYFSKLENIWFKLGWQKAVDNSTKVVAISDFTKKDIENKLKRANNVVRIYNPICLNDSIKYDFNSLSKEYNIKKNEYYYTVCSLYKHKNLATLIKVMERIKNNKIDIPNKLVISGVGGPNKDNLLKEIKDKGLEDNIILTKFVSNEERNSLIKNSNCFLFPSIFEGFGMPPVEAIMLGTKVISTKKTSLEEVTMNKCDYINDPFDIDEWIDKIKKIQTKKTVKYDFPEYDKLNIAREYLNLFYKITK